jgi:Uma2 family endonuclease
MTTTDAPAKLMTTEEFLALPDDGVERMLIRGVVYEMGREEENGMTRRNPTHSFVEANVTGVLRNWSRGQAEPRGRVYCGEAGFRIRRNPDTTVAIDVAYVDALTAGRTPKDAGLVDGPPILAVEVLSPSDTQEGISVKVQDYLSAGTKLVWVLESVFETVTVYRPDAPPLMLHAGQELTAEPHLPGFRCSVREFFED